jgi:hypothetical protein
MVLQMLIRMSMLPEAGQITEEKPLACPIQVLDKTGKKLRVFKKDLVSD